MIKSSLILFCFLATCMGKKQNPEPMFARQWMLIQYKDYKKPYLIEKKAAITISKDQSANIYMGCNNAGAQIKIKGDNQIQFLNIMSTEMACEDMNLESDIFMTLSAVGNYKLEGHYLYLYTKNGDSLKFVASDWD